MFLLYELYFRYINFVFFFTGCSMEDEMSPKEI